MFRLLLLTVLALGCAGCAAGRLVAAGGPEIALAQALPGVAGLDALKGAAEVQPIDIDVTAPLASGNTTPDFVNVTLGFAAPADDLAWAIYRIEMPNGTPLSGLSAGSNTLWILAADYSAGHWVGATQYADGSATLDLTTVGDLESPGGFMYLAVVCPHNTAGQLDMLTLMYDAAESYNLKVTDLLGPGDFNIASRLDWDSGLAETYKVYRSVIPNDPAPYQISTVSDSYPMGNMHIDFLNTDSADDTALPAIDDNDTPGDTTDDFFMLQPGVVYYYRVVGYTGTEISGTSAEVRYLCPWSTRRTGRRPLPSTASQTRVFADQLDTGSMSLAQATWAGMNLVGTQKILKPDAMSLRIFNPDFLVLGYHLGNGAGNIGNVCGNSWDADADWPNVNQHEDWFLHVAGSSEPNERVRQTNWDWYAADPLSPWQDYLPSHLFELQGENFYDGWFVDSCHQLWNTNPTDWWPVGETMFGYFTPRLHSMLRKLTLAAAAHPLQPYIIPNAGSYITTLSDIKYYGADWTCDGIMIEGHAHYNPDLYFDEVDWVLEHDRILDHQAHGLATILQTDIFTPNTADRLFVYGSYLLVRGDHTYINWLGDDGLDTIFPGLPQWYPEFDIDAELGAPAEPPTATMADMLTAEGLYRRNFTFGFVLVNPSDTAKTYTFPYLMQKLVVDGGGNITTDGAKQGSHSWATLMGTQNLPPHSALIILDILD